MLPTLKKPSFSRQKHLQHPHWEAKFSNLQWWPHPKLLDLSRHFLLPSLLPAYFKLFNFSFSRISPISLCPRNTCIEGDEEQNPFSHAWFSIFKRRQLAKQPWCSGPSKSSLNFCSSYYLRYKCPHRWEVRGTSWSSLGSFSNSEEFGSFLQLFLLFFLFLAAARRWFSQVQSFLAPSNGSSH